MKQERRNRIAQWVFDTRPILGRFHLWIEDVEERRISGDSPEIDAFSGAPLARSFVAAAAVTALGTRLFGRWGEGKGRDKMALNRVKKDADAVSAYVMSEALWYLTRRLPENHAVMVCLGEGLMPKGGETPEMGSNPLLGFGRVYARPEVATFLDRHVHRLINEPGYGWGDFYRDVQAARITIWGAALDTLENTSRFATGEPTGPMTILQLYDQPLVIATPYEGYFGNLVLPREVVEAAAERSILLTYQTPRARVVEVVRSVYPDVPRERIHVWTLGGPARRPRLEGLWAEWTEAGAHVIESGWRLPGGGEVFTDSGTYAAVFRCGPFEDEHGDRHLFLCDGYAASAEAIQGASLDEALDLSTSLCPLTSIFQLPSDVETHAARLDPEAPDFADQLAALAGRELEPELADSYQESVRVARDAGVPQRAPALSVDAFFPHKKWRALTVDGFIQPDPYSGFPGVEEVEDGVYRVAVRAATRHGVYQIQLTLRLQETREESRLVFSPLLDRFYAGQDYRTRAVKVSDSGRLRNELQTLCSGGLDYVAGDRIRLDLTRIDDAVLPAEKKRVIREVLEWYKANHPTWFRWLELAE